MCGFRPRTPLNGSKAWVRGAWLYSMRGDFGLRVT